MKHGEISGDANDAEQGGIVVVVEERSKSGDGEKLAAGLSLEG